MLLMCCYVFQTILVSGDSGSGKTESTKFMMQYLAAVATHKQDSQVPETKLNPNLNLNLNLNTKSKTESIKPSDARET